MGEEAQPSIPQSEESDLLTRFLPRVLYALAQFPIIGPFFVKGSNCLFF